MRSIAGFGAVKCTLTHRFIRYSCAQLGGTDLVRTGPAGRSGSLQHGSGTQTSVFRYSKVFKNIATNQVSAVILDGTYRGCEFGTYGSLPAHRNVCPNYAPRLYHIPHTANFSKHFPAVYYCQCRQTSTYRTNNGHRGPSCGRFICT